MNLGHGFEVNFELKSKAVMHLSRVLFFFPCFLFSLCFAYISFISLRFVSLLITCFVLQRLSYQFRMLVSIVVVSWINWDPWKIGRTSSACNIHMRFCFQFLPFPKHDFGKPRQFRCMCIYKWCFVMLRHYSLRKSLGLFL